MRGSQGGYPARKGNYTFGRKGEWSMTQQTVQGIVNQAIVNQAIVNQALGTAQQPFHVKR
jgi:hypothetical protein